MCTCKGERAHAHVCVRMSARAMRRTRKIVCVNVCERVRVVCLHGVRCVCVCVCVCVWVGGCIPATFLSSAEAIGSPLARRLARTCAWLQQVLPPPGSAGPGVARQAVILDGQRASGAVANTQGSENATPYKHLPTRAPPHARRARARAPGPAAPRTIPRLTSARPCPRFGGGLGSWLNDRGPQDPRDGASDCAMCIHTSAHGARARAAGQQKLNGVAGEHPRLGDVPAIWSALITRRLSISSSPPCRRTNDDGTGATGEKTNLKKTLLARNALGSHAKGHLSLSAGVEGTWREQQQSKSSHGSRWHRSDHTLRPALPPRAQPPPCTLPCRPRGHHVQLGRPRSCACAARN